MRKRPTRERAEQHETQVGPASGQLVADHETSSSRKRIGEVVPAQWLDLLLGATLDLPLASGELPVVEAMVDALVSIVEGCAVGVCFVPEAGPGAGEQTIVKRMPASFAERPAGIDPTRVFPGMAREHVVSIPGSTTGSTLHVASNEEDLEEAASPVVHLAERAAMALGRSLACARTMASHAASAEPDALASRMLQADKLAHFGQLAAGVVHELNNPLTSIVAYSDYLIRKSVARGPSSDADDLERLRRISESANRMLHFTRDLVSYARPSTGIAGPVVLHTVIDQAVAFCEHVLSAAAVRVERRYGADVLAIRGVGEQIVQVFVNLLTNASQAAPARGGSVVLTTRLLDGTRRVSVVVEDNGSGIAPEHLQHVFVPFFTTKGDRHGTGLGLSIVKSIVESHDGAIRVESDYGRGARFVVELPVWSKS